MKFLSLKLCKELQSAGIVNESGFVWVPDQHVPRYYGGRPAETFNDARYVPAYVAEIAFLGPSETAKENARKWCGDHRPQQSEAHRELLNELDTTKESVEDFLRRTRRAQRGDVHERSERGRGGDE